MSWLSGLRIWFGGKTRAVAGQGTAKADPVQQRLAEGMAYLNAGRSDSARACFTEILSSVPEHSQALHYLGILHAQAGEFGKAVELIGKAVALGPPNAEACGNFGNALRKLDRKAEALAAYDQAITVDPGYVYAYFNRGYLYLELKDWSAALADFDAFVERIPDSADAWNGRGDALSRLKRHEEALSSFERALALAPQSVNVLINRGSALTSLRRYTEAAAVFRQAIGLEPDNYVAHYNLGTVLLQGLMSASDAVVEFDEAIRLRPDYGPSYHNRANAFDELGRYREAIADFNSALRFGSEEASTPGMLMYTRMRICEWDDFSARRAEIVTRTENGERVAVAFMMLALTGRLSVQRKIADIVADYYFSNTTVFPPIAKRSRHERIRIGYFSADLRNHPVAYLTAELFELHDPAKFEVVVFSFGPYDELTRRVNAAVEDYIDARTLTDEDVVELARTLKIDIAVDLGGYTAHNRSSIFAMRVAPIQVSYLGYPGTMGNGMHDYLMADHVLIPAEHEHWYAEKLAFLPVYQINDSKRQISDRSFSRAELGLPEAGFVFCCFNNTVKFNPEIFDVWARILKAVEGSVLFLLAVGEDAMRNIVREAEARGVSADRIVLGGRLARPEYLARYRACDLFLDTLPFNAGTTASDALWAGLPVLTCMGEAFASRMAGSLLTALKLPELITSTLEDYERVAIELATDATSLSGLRDRLARALRDELLFDTHSVASHIEAAYSMMYERYLAELPAAMIEVPRDQGNNDSRNYV